MHRVVTSNINLNSRTGSCSSPWARIGTVVLAWVAVMVWAANGPSAEAATKSAGKATAAAKPAVVAKPAAAAKSVAAVKPATAEKNAAGKPIKSDQPAPVIHLDSLEHNFGELWAGPEVKCTFTIHNKGNAPLKILNANPGCSSCTVLGEYTKEIAPGKSGTLPVTLKTEVLRGPTTKVVTLTTNDKAKSSVALMMRGNFRRRIEVNPVGAFFGPIFGDQPLSKTIKLKNNTDKKLELKLAPYKSDRFKFELVETTPGQEYELRVNTILPYKKGDMNAAVALDSNIEQEKIVRISASARVPERLDLLPATMYFHKPPQLPPGRDYVPLFFWLTNYGTNAVEVMEASVDDPAIKTKIDVQAPGKKFRIEVQVPGKEIIPPDGRILTIKTNDPEKPTLTAKIVNPPKFQPRPPTPPIVGKKPTTQPATRPAQTRPAQTRPALSMLGKSAPAFNMKTLEGRDFTRSGADGQITVVNYVSPSCSWCRKQIPPMEKVRAAYQDKGVRFVMVVTPNPTGKHLYTNEEIIQSFASLGSNMEIALDADRSFGRSLKATSYPSMFVIGREGKIVAVVVGAKRNQFELVSAQLDAVLAGKPVPTSMPASAPAATQPH